MKSPKPAGAGGAGPWHQGYPSSAVSFHPAHTIIPGWKGCRCCRGWEGGEGPFTILPPPLAVSFTS
ncbi:MAG: hypothetical protein OEY56_12015, partial [Cyclobacteriaceae bacterium]|nr:hypothetical protein [Cyclobacteriaceae bacterium]